MFTLRETHNQAFQTKAEADFVREVMQYLRENHTETVVKLPNGEFKVIDLPEKTLQKMVEGGVVKARSYGFERRRYLNSFIVIMFVSAPNFDTNQEILFILKSDDFQNIRFNNILLKTTDETWANILADYSAEEWGIK